MKKLPHVRKANDAAATPELLTAYVETNLKTYMPALTTLSESGTGGDENEDVGGTEFVEQGSGTERTSAPRGRRDNETELMRRKIGSGGISYSL